MRRIDELSGSDLYDSPDVVYCRNCKNFDSVNNDCFALDIEEDIKPDKPMEYCLEYEEGESSVDEGIIRYLENYSRMDEKIKARCIEAINAQKHSKVEEYDGDYYCSCGCPVECFFIPYNGEIGKQPYCSECGAKLDWEGVEIQIGE